MISYHSEGKSKEGGNAAYEESTGTGTQNPPQRDDGWKSNRNKRKSNV